MYPEVHQVNYTVNESDSVTFECIATGIPAPNIYFNFTSITSRVQVSVLSSPIEVTRLSDGEMVYQVTQTAVITSTVDSDSGVYECIATNDIPGMDSVQFELIVQGMSRFTLFDDWSVVKLIDCMQLLISCSNIHSRASGPHSH